MKEIKKGTERLETVFTITLLGQGKKWFCVNGRGIK